MLKKLLLAIITVFTVILLLAATIPFFFKTEIDQKMKATINAKVNAKVDFADYDLSLISSFPNLGIKIHNLNVVGVDSFAKDTLAKIKSLQVNLNLWSVLKGQTYQIKSVALQEPNIYAKVLKSGKANWDILKPSAPQNADTANKSAFKIAINQYEIEQGRIVYDDASLGFFMDLKNVNHTGKGDFTQDLIALSIQSDIENATVTYAGIPYLNGVKLDAELPLEIDVKQMKFTFGENKIKLNELLLTAVGYFSMPNSEDINMDFKFDAKESDLKNFLSLVPAIYANNFKDMEATGKFALSGTAKGIYNDKSLPAFKLNMGIQDGKIKYPSLPSSINNIQMRSVINNPDGILDHTIVDVPTFHLEFGQVPVDGRLLLKNLNTDPFVDMALKGKLDLKELTAIFPMKDIALSGLLAVDVAAAGRKSSIDQGAYQNFNASGQILANNFIYTGKNVPMPVHISNAKMVFSPKNITLSQLVAKLGKSDFEASGSINNYLAYFFKPNQPLSGRFNLSSNLIDLNELMGKKPEISHKSSVQNELNVFQVPGNLDFGIAAKAGKVLYDNFDLSNVKGGLLIKDKAINFNNIGMEMLDGILKMNGTYATINPQKPHVNVDFGIEKMNIQKTFAAFNTIKLLAPVAKYTNGVFTTQLKFNSDLDQHMMPVYESINAQGLTNIVQAVVAGFEPLNKLASALGTNALKQLAVNNLIAKFNIQDGRLNVAPFDIKKDGIVMNVKGSNGLDQSIAYDLALNVPREMLGTRANEAANALLAKVNRSVGTSVAIGDKIKANAAMGGTIMKPTLNLKYALVDTKSAAKAVLDNVVAEKKVEIQRKAQEKVDTLKAKATKKIEETISDKLNGLFRKRN
ncbi:AsmA-like C-terminal region-containing protein [Pedobacter sandarakinus]|uniref:AsmA-like C-terminal region-containing protein n=1 Tax=Pedobacter sandarakinus TaxID=353156 RepID=UPI002245D71B|nr:AsmA-like C-terminal region-containing protein [Pedobacter sandarakinus]MCX2573938.1 membrane assembly protein AsmA [Pedobacter sandarakinus]